MKRFLLLAIVLIVATSCQTTRKKNFVGGVKVQIVNSNKVDIYVRIHNCMGEADTTFNILPGDYFTKDKIFSYKAESELQYNINDIFYQGLQIANPEESDSYVSVYLDNLLTEHVVTWSIDNKREDIDFFNMDCWYLEKEAVPLINTLFGEYVPAYMFFHVKLNDLEK